MGHEDVQVPWKQDGVQMLGTCECQVERRQLVSELDQTCENSDFFFNGANGPFG